MHDRPESYFTRIDEHRYEPTVLTSGAWSTDEQHISPLNGLTVHAIERFVAAQGLDDKAVARVSYDILGPVAIEPLEIRVELVRPGRSVDLVEATVTSRGRSVLRARAWRLASHDTAAVAGGQADPLPDPDTLVPWPMKSVWPGDYIRSIDVRSVTEPAPGRATVWISTDAVLVPDEPVSELARYVGLIDTANGIAVRRSPDEWLFPNLDLTVHLFRQPRGRWVGLDTAVTFGPTGQGLTSTVLHDADGEVGRAEQILMLRPRV